MTMKTQMRLCTALMLLVLAAMAASPGCNSSNKGDSGAARASREQEAAETIAAFRRVDPGLKKFFDTATGWAVFPTVAKGGLIVGGARGEGVVYEGGGVVGYSVLSQGTVGAQIGGQAYSELIFFRDAVALQHFKAGNSEFSAQASAVAASAGASADADYAEGVIVFTMAKGGLMLEASIGGQHFSFSPK
jgi:lipid-binding SYLF domain-containing protein